MGWSRRALLLSGVAALTGCTMPSPRHWPDRPPPGQCFSPESLVEFSAVDEASLGYEVTRSATTFRSDPRFLELLDAWAADWAGLSGLGPVEQIWSYGAYVDKCSSLHAAGRAFDFAEVVHQGGSISCRFDLWQPGSPEQLRNYWRMAASLHLHFAYTLTYLYNQQHHNHIHVDNAVSGFDGPPSFNSRSQVQVQLVQAGLAHVFGAAVEITGQWDAQTRDALRPVQADLGITEPLRELEGWQAFLRATARG